ncbi:hypothetical protein H4R20_004517 [Coemansia guatemalensis]|uniref:Cysteine dioxygenase n=1 Tax=Coemansia guatemalensis TaxID=2761395 RepID=A0A9W8HTJ2_9FUNG|nr:hypothetical protein H4R20_004517 [Coemansia guatemalensis]
MSNANTSSIPEESVSKNPTNMQELISSLNAVMGDQGLGEDLETVRRVKQLMRSYVSKSQDWEKYAVYQDGTRYTRNLVDDGNGKYNLLILVWGENQASPIHDHAGSHCMMKLLAGQLDEDLFAWPSSNTCKSNLHMKRSAGLNTNSVAYMHDKIGLHRISNPSSTEKAVSLHLYSPPYDMCKVFDEATGAAVASSCAVQRLARPEHTACSTKSSTSLSEMPLSPAIRSS